uniref:Uncharacterized protein n=1 Tax=Anguilla anguilla TaxID=7936 RepID=A0A0E9QGT1_ANGAN
MSLTIIHLCFANSAWFFFWFFCAELRPWSHTLFEIL